MNSLVDILILDVSWGLYSFDLLTLRFGLLVRTLRKSRLFTLLS